MVCLFVAVVAIVSTAHLPIRPCQEVRYELRIRDYRKNVDQPEAVLNGLELVDGRAMCGWLDSIASNYEGEVTTSCDRSEKITLQVRSDEASVAEATAKTLYTLFCDSVSRYASKACAIKAEEYSRQIDSLLHLPSNDNIQSLISTFANRRAILLADNAGGVKYIEVLNSAEAGTAHRTPPRLLVILLATIAAMLLCFAIRLYVRATRNGENNLAS